MKKFIGQFFRALHVTLGMLITLPVRLLIFIGWSIWVILLPHPTYTIKDQFEIIFDTYIMAKKAFVTYIKYGRNQFVDDSEKIADKLNEIAEI